MQLRDQTPRPTLARKLGDVTHISPLLRKVRQLSGCSEERVGEWLLKCAVERGATHYRRSFDPLLPPDNPSMTDEELGIALCLYQHPYDAMFIRAAAQLLSTSHTNPPELAHFAVMERCEPVLMHIARAAQRVAPEQEPWAYLRTHLAERHQARTDTLPHWSRFVLQTGFTPAGRGQHITWLTRDE